MDRHTLQKLADAGAIIGLPEGKWGIKVLLEYRQAVPANTYRDTKRFLQTKFEELARAIPGLKIDFDNISVTELTANGTLPLERLDELRRLLRGRQIHLQVSRDELDVTTE